MRRFLLPLALLGWLPLLMPAADDKKPEEGFTSLFNGKDLTGWVRVNNAPKTFFVKEKMIVTTGVPTGFMRTDKMYENFILELEWRHIPPKPDAVGNSGVFVWADALPAVGSPFTRAIEVQVLVNLEWKDRKTGGVTASSHGDLFSIWGARCVPDRPHPLGWERCIPSENRAKGAGEWNHYRVEARDGVIKLAVNGKVVSGVSKVKPRKGYLALEAEGSECHFRNLKIKELPSTKPKPEEVCQEGKGHVTLFSGLDLSGWKVDEAQKKNWSAHGGPNLLRYDGKAKIGTITTQKEFGDYELVFDCRAAKKDTSVGIDLRGKDSDRVVLKVQPGKWHRYQITVQGQKATLKTSEGTTSIVTRDLAAKGPLGLAAEGACEFTNLFIRELK
jgi:hypothetical protein